MKINRMRTVFFLLLLSIFTTGVFAQKKGPVTWSFTAKKLAGNKYELHSTAVLDNTWHIYSQKTSKEGIPTEFTFAPNALVSKPAMPKEVGKLIKKYDEGLRTNVMYFADKVDFVQTVTVKGNIKTNISGKVFYTVCDDSKCLPPTEVSFNIALQ